MMRDRSVYLFSLGCSELLDRLDELGYDVSPEDRPDAKRLDAVIADFPWAAVGRGWKMLDNLIRPSHLLIYHLPFAEDDIKGYRNMTRIVVKRFRNIPDVRIFEEFLQTETLP